MTITTMLHPVAVVVAVLVSDINPLMGGQVR